MTKDKAIKIALFAGGFVVGQHIQSVAMRLRLQDATARAYAHCNTPKDIAVVDSVFQSMNSNRST